MRERTAHLAVLLVAVRPQPLVALLAVLRPQRVGIERDSAIRADLGAHRSAPPRRDRSPSWPLSHIAINESIVTVDSTLPSSSTIS